MRGVWTLVSSLGFFASTSTALISPIFPDCWGIRQITSPETSIYPTGSLFQKHLKLKSSKLFAEMQIWCDSRFSAIQAVEHLSAVDALLVCSSSASPTPDHDSPKLPKYKVEKTAQNDDHDRLVKDGNLVGIMVNITEEKGQQTALAAVGSVEWILAYAEEGGDARWRMIPAENLIGAATQTGTKIAFAVNRVQDVVGLSQALQVGVDALCISADASKELWDAVAKAKEQRQEQAKFNSNSQISLEKEEDSAMIVPGKCWRMPLSGSSSVVADRVCIDFVRALEPTEGCWIGSSAKVMSLVLSEAAASSFVPSRPFRVNAGPVHSYVCLGDGIRTKYLCELQAGDEVLVYNAATGESRPVAVGRLKIEVRPCVLVGLKEHLSDDIADSESKTKPAEGQIFLQQAETVRLGNKDGDYVRVTDVEIASFDETAKHSTILLRTTSSGTHVGGRYEGKVTEK